MSLHYYNRLVEGNLHKARGIKESTHNALTPFYQYLDTAIKSLRSKQDICVGWTALGTEKVQLITQSKIYQKKYKTEIRVNITNEWYFTKNFPSEPNFKEFLIWKEGKKKFTLQPEDVDRSNQHARIRIKGFTFPEDLDEIQLNWEFDDFSILKPSQGFDKVENIQVGGREVKFKKMGEIYLIYAKFTERSEININEIPVFFEIISDNYTKKNKEHIIRDGLEECIFLSDTLLSEPDTIEMNPLEFFRANPIQPEDIKEKGTNNTFEYKYIDNIEILLFSVNKPAEYLNKVFAYKDFTFKVKIVSPSSKEKFQIRIFDLEDDAKDDPYSRSSVDYFYDPDVEVKIDGEKDRFKIGYRNQEESIISLKLKGRDVLPPIDSKTLRISISTYQLDKQKEAIFNIQNKPIREQRKFIQLFEPRNEVDWSFRANKQSIKNWYVLQDPNRKGCVEQREFIHKALSSPDFAILEGPPGSGKTTVILELICQLVLNKKRVLLCGSTHVAIDNVLERLKEKGLTEELNILPIRIGNEDVVSDSIQDYRLEKQLETHSVGESLLLESANLVCGTTIGILKHPEFNAQRADETPILPSFDYLIIDECSKTTFQEFLVPALFAKKWILVGDVHQLSPFADREQMVSNLRELFLGKDRQSGKVQTLPKSIQDACYKLYLVSQYSNYRNKNSSPLPLAFVIDDNYFSKLREEYNFRKKENKQEFIQKLKIDFWDFNMNSLKNYSKVWETLYNQDVLFIPRSQIDYALNYLPEYYFVFGYPEWTESSHYFRHRRLYKKDKYNFSIQEKGRSITSFEEIYNAIERQMQERDWAEEMCWRLVRDFELRNKKQEFGFRKDMEILYPLSEKQAKSRIATIRNIALPSILEGIQKGIKGKYNQEQTTITEGFTEEELESRYVKLKYQHRMHSQIAEFPKKAFYDNLALETDPDIDLSRKWNYNRYKHRKVWVDVRGRTNNNRNEEEVKVGLEELKAFIEWCKNQGHPDPLEKDQKWKIAVLTFYKGQEKLIREKLQEYCNQPNKQSQFSKENSKIFLYTVDKFQGQEADIVFLSMVQTQRDGFLDSPNRLNVSITRARYQLVIMGKYQYFSDKSKSDELKALATSFQNFKISRDKGKEFHS
jgi:superfamily I DNA and/or RNA helicase